MNGRCSQDSGADLTRVCVGKAGGISLLRCCNSGSPEDFFFQVQCGSDGGCLND